MPEQDQRPEHLCPEAAELHRLTEREIIRKIASRFTSTDERVVVPSGDDAAVFWPGHRADGAVRLNQSAQVISTDMLVEGVHFSLECASLADVGYKALAVNLSDLAAMGASPSFVLGNLGVPTGITDCELDALLDGIAAAIEGSGLELLGGDTVSAPQWIIGFTLLGETPLPALRRTGAQPGDVLWHTGSLGLSQVGLHTLWGNRKQSKPGAASGAELNTCIAAHLRPEPQLAMGNWLREHKLATACLDLSDSLSQCVELLATASSVGVQLDFSAYPFHDAVQGFCLKCRRRKSLGPFKVVGKLNPGGQALQFDGLAEFILASSEDYQLLFTAPTSATTRLLRDAPAPITRVGTVLGEDEGLLYRNEQGASCRLQPMGWEH